MNNEVIDHYDRLIEENNDPVHDNEALSRYMDKWDGDAFIDALNLDSSKTVLEIGVGTGRLAKRVLPFCKHFCGIDVSPKTIVRAEENLADFENKSLVCADFMSYKFDELFDVIYSSLTFMHIEDKLTAFNKVATLLNYGGRFVLSVDKNRDEYIDCNDRKIKIYPDEPTEIRACIRASRLIPEQFFETEFAYIFVALK